MEHGTVVKAVSDFYEVEPEPNGEFDPTLGCRLENGLWLNLASVVDCVEEILENIKQGILND